MKLTADANELLTALRAPELSPFLDEWPVSHGRRSARPEPVPVLRCLPELRAAAPSFSARLTNAVADAAPLLAWRRSYSSAQVGDAFLENYGWTELMGLEGPTPSERLACGMLILGPHVIYPLHWHEAEEIYVPLVGKASWKCGSEGWREREPGEVIYHARHQPHAMRTGACALLALYLWRSDDLKQKSRFAPE
jgi:hypothetical protein